MTEPEVVGGILATLKAWGPFTAPLCAAMVYALRWLARRLDAAEQRERDIVQQLRHEREQHLDTMGATTLDYQTLARELTRALRERAE